MAFLDHLPGIAGSYGKRKVAFHGQDRKGAFSGLKRGT